MKNKDGRESSMKMQSLKKSASLRFIFDGVVVEINNRQILRGVWGSVNSGELMALMGPSGSGKTTLLNTISGRQPMKEGTVTINNCKLNKDLSRRIVYVLQHDIFPSKLTLREMLRFTSMIKLPENMSDEARQNRIDAIVSDLGLSKCLDTVCGSPWVRGLSGGEKKRANIACELLTDPDIIMIDEPTSGLDSTLAYKLMENLQQLAKDQNKIVVATIHQPSSHIFHMFHGLLILSDGKVVYHGDAQKCLEVFEGFGLCCEEHYNPADFILDSVQVHDTRVGNIIENAEKNYRSIATAISIEPADVEEGRNSIPEVTSMVSKEEKVLKWPSSFWTQFKWIAWRDFKQSRSRIVSKFEIFRTIVLGVTIGLLYFQTERTEDRIRDIKGLLFFMVVQWSFQPMIEAILAVPEEKELLYKERAAGYYRLSAYYIAKMVVESPLTIVLPILSFILVCIMAGLTNPAVITNSVITIVLHSILSQGFGLLFGVAFMEIQWGLTFSTVFILISMLCVGFYAERLPPWLVWTRNLSFISYTYNILVMLEFGTGEPVRCLNKTTASSFGLCKDGAESVPDYMVVEASGIDIPLYGNFILLIGLMFLVRLAGYFILRFKHHPSG